MEKNNKTLVNVINLLGGYTKKIMIGTYSRCFLFLSLLMVSGFLFSKEKVVCFPVKSPVAGPSTGGPGGSMQKLPVMLFDAEQWKALKVKTGSWSAISNDKHKNILDTLKGNRYQIDDGKVDLQRIGTQTPDRKIVASNSDSLKSQLDRLLVEAPDNRNQNQINEFKKSLESIDTLNYINYLLRQNSKKEFDLNKIKESLLQGESEIHLQFK